MVHADVIVESRPFRNLDEYLWTPPKSLLQMSSTQIGLFNLTVLLSTIVGAYLAGYLNRRFNPLFSFRLLFAALSVVTALMSVFVQDPSKCIFLLSAAIGVIWLARPDGARPLCTLAPVGQEAK
jgi:MFS family permease